MGFRTSKTALLLLLCVTLRAGEGDLGRFESVEPHMGTMFRIVLYAPDLTTAHAAFTAAFRRVTELDAILSDYNTHSELMRVCATASARPVKVSEDLFRVLEVSQKLAEQTNGAFDVTLGPVIHLWRTARQEDRTPPRVKLKSAARRCGYRKMVLDGEKHTVFLKSPDMLLDLGGIGKGYAADEALKTLRSYHITRALVAASGDLAIGDAPPGKEGWRIGIDSINAPTDGFTRILILKDAAVSTSGDTSQFLQADGQRYSHIVNPKTDMGLTRRVGVTIVATKGIFADSLATAVSVLGPERGMKFIEKNWPNAAALIVTMTGGQTRTRESTRFRSLPHATLP